MPTLYQFHHTTAAAHLPLLTSNDRLLLLEEGIYLLLDSGFLQALPDGLARHVLATDLQARGLQARLPDDWTALDDQAWVALTLAVDRVCSC